MALEENKRADKVEITKAADKKVESVIPEENKKADKVGKNTSGANETYIMTVGHLSWGLNNKSHFYADKKPLINAKVMGNYSNTLLVWLKEGWIKKGSYK